MQVVEGNIHGFVYLLLQSLVCEGNSTLSFSTTLPFPFSKIHQLGRVKATCPVASQAAIVTRSLQSGLLGCGFSDILRGPFSFTTRYSRFFADGRVILFPPCLGGNLVRHTLSISLKLGCESTATFSHRQSPQSNNTIQELRQTRHG